MECNPVVLVFPTSFEALQWISFHHLSGGYVDDTLLILKSTVIERR